MRRILIRVIFYIFFKIIFIAISMLLFLSSMNVITIKARHINLIYLFFGSMALSLVSLIFVFGNSDKNKERINDSQNHLQRDNR